MTMITIVGPTASGKSALAIKLAKKFNGEIICADSRTIYKYMDIGTAKASSADQKEITHYGLDLIEPGQNFSAADFKNYAQESLDKIKAKNKLPILVGGSGLYIDAVLFDYKFRPNNKKEINKMSMDKLVKLAAQLYPKELEKIDIKNRRRLEQLIIKGPTKTNDRKMQKIDSLVIGVSVDKLKLAYNIKLRTEQMLSSGFVQEVKWLTQRYGEDCPQLRATGYYPVVEYINGKISLEDCENQIIKQTKDLAKKQTTWFKRNPNIVWVEPKSIHKVYSLVSQYLSSDKSFAQKNSLKS